MAVRAIALALLISSAGCSLMFIEPVPAKWTPRQEPRCTATSGFVLWDLAYVAGDVILAALAYNAIQKNNDIIEDNDSLDSTKGHARRRNSNMRVYIGIASAEAALRITSAVVGTRRVNRCTEARKQRDAFVLQQPKPRRQAAPKSPSQVQLEELQRRVRELEAERGQVQPPPPPPAEAAPPPAQ